jgi:hypothetical protein
VFDREKSVTLEGTVKEFQRTNPHCWVQLMVRDPVTGKEVEWSLEGIGPNGLSRWGWTRTSLKDGMPSGQLVTVTVDGKTLSNQAT